MRPWIPSAIADVLASYAAPAPAGQDGKARGRVFDATAFHGAALRLLGAAWNCDTYGTEPTQAWRDTAIGTTRIVEGDLDAARIAPASMSAVAGVVPHTPDDLQSRQHTAFARDLLAALAAGGLAAILGPAAAFDQGLCTTLLRRLHPADVFALPFSPGEVIVIGVATTEPRTGERPGQFAKRIAAGTLAPFPRAAAPWCALPAAASGDGFFFGPHFLSYADLADMSRQTGVWFAPAFADELVSRPERTIRPVLPLRRGHLALLIAAGMFDNLVIERDGRRLALKGRTYKTVSTSRDDDVIRTRERFRTSIGVLDLDSGDFSLLQDG